MTYYLNLTELWFKQKLKLIISKYPVLITTIIVTLAIIVAVFLFGVKLMSEITIKEIFGFIFYSAALLYALTIELPKIFKK